MGGEGSYYTPKAVKAENWIGASVETYEFGI
jgi:hypothetical protein